jgi:hypothetical protein
MDKTNEVKRSKMGQWLAGMLSVLSLFAPARASSLDASRYFSDAKTAAFVESLQRGNASKVKKALAAGQDPNAEGLQGIRPIHFIYRRPNLEAVEALLMAGADPNLPAPNGNRPLHYAVQQETADLALLLLKYKANPALPGENGKLVLYLAMSSPEAARLLPALVAAGADVNLRRGSMPPVQAAMASHDWVAAKVLLQLGADPMGLASYGEDAVTMYCSKISRSVRSKQTQGVVYEVGKLLRADELKPECVPDMERFR